MNLDILHNIVRTLEAAVDASQKEGVERSQSYWRALCKSSADVLREQIDKEVSARELEATCLR